MPTTSMKIVKLIQLTHRKILFKELIRLFNSKEVIKKNK
jgi:hypothetical protein